ncbi:thiolase family protein [Desulfobacula sp.]|uniref:thiolase family protein n=1 Tax=Desulfobacula sp. TaxID=2593537 RepID=UPI002603192D|nr:thiolase family protein [Desulfobacula sp.]
MTFKNNDVFVIDAVRTAFGRAGEKGIFWKTRAEDMSVAVLQALMKRNPQASPEIVEDVIWGATNQIGEQGGTIGRMISMLADWGWEVPGCSVDRMCAGGLTAVGFGVSYIASGMADCLVAGGVEHMGHLPMGYMRDSHPRSEEVMGDASAFNMGMTAENIHDMCPEFNKEMADAYAVACQQKTNLAVTSGKMKDMIIPMEVELADGTRITADTDQHPRPETTMESLGKLKTPFRENGRVTAGNASGLNDGAAAVLLMNGKKSKELGITPNMRWVSTAVASVDPRIMGIAPVPATLKALSKAGLTMDDIDIIELNEAFAIQALYDLDRLDLKADDPRVNIWGGAIAYGHPLASSGPRLIAFMQGLFKENPTARYGLTSMCVGRGQGYSMIWENLNRQ